MSGHPMNLRSNSRNNSHASATSEAAHLADTLHTQDIDAKRSATSQDVSSSPPPAITADALHSLEARLLAAQHRNEELMERLERLLATQLRTRVDSQPHVIPDSVTHDGSPLASGAQGSEAQDGLASPSAASRSHVPALLDMRRAPQTPGPHSVMTQESEDVLRAPVRLGKIPTIPIDAFNGKNKDITVTQWLLQFKNIMDSAGYSETVAVRLAGLKLAGPAQAWYAREGRLCTRWQQFASGLSTRYGVRVDRDLAQQEGEKIRQGKDESVEEFYDRILTTLSHYGITDEADAIVSYSFRRGLSDAVYDRVLDHYAGIGLDTISISDLLQRARIEEAVLSRRRARQGTQRSDGAAAPRATAYTSSTQLAVGERDLSGVKCHKCGGMGHFANRCPSVGKPVEAAVSVPPPRPAANAGKCSHCGGAHSVDACWKLHPEKRPNVGVGAGVPGKNVARMVHYAEAPEPSL